MKSIGIVDSITHESNNVLFMTLLLRYKANNNKKCLVKSWRVVCRHDSLEFCVYDFHLLEWCQPSKDGSFASFLLELFVVKVLGGNDAFDG